MRLKEIIRRNKEVMHPERFRLNYRIIPIWLAVLLAVTVGLCVLVAVEGSDLWFFALLAFIVLWMVFLIVVAEKVSKKELKMAQDEYAYLFEETDGSDTPVESVDEELHIKFLVKKDGLQITYPTQGETVFAEMGEDTEFLPWTDTYLALASDNFCRRVRLALVVIDKTKQAVVDDSVLPPEPFFLPMSKELYNALVGFGLVEEVGSDFYYLRKNPEKGMKQILNFGYVRNFR